MAEGVTRRPATKAGYRTTEFWISLGIGLLGAWLIMRGHEEIGAMLLAASGTGYSVSRGLAK